MQEAVPTEPAHWISVGRWRGLVAAVAPSAETLAALIAAADAMVGENVLKTDDRSRVVRVAQEGRSYVVKQYHVPWPRRGIYAWLRVSPAWREWRGGRRLAAVPGCRAAPAVALLRAGSDERLVLPYVEGETLDAVIGTAEANPGRDRRDLARRLGEQAGRLAAAGWVNRDYKPTNLIVDAACRDGAPPLMIDAAGVVRRRSDRHALRMLTALHRAARKAGPISDRELLTCLDAMLAADPSLLRGAADRRRAAIAMLSRAP